MSDTVKYFACPPDLPDNFTPIILVFAEANSKSNTQLYCHCSDDILNALKTKSMAQRMKVIKTICGNIEAMLLQYSTNPGEVKVREITQ